MAAIVSVLYLTCGCVTIDDSGANMNGDIRSVCDIPAILEGQSVRVRGLFTAYANGYVLIDENCPRYLLSLKRTEHGPDTTLCTPERLVEVFGCPGGNDNGPLVTVSGVIGPVRTPNLRTITVDEMSDFENVRTGEHVIP